MNVHVGCGGDFLSCTVAERTEHGGRIDAGCYVCERCGMVYRRSVVAAVVGRAANTLERWERIGATFDLHLVRLFDGRSAYLRVHAVPTMGARDGG